MTTTAPVQYRLASCEAIYAPNVVAFCIAHHPTYRKAAIHTLCTGWGIPRHAATYLIDGGAYTVEGETVVFTA